MPSCSLRHALHCAEEQLEREGITVTFKQLLAQAIFAGSALISHNGATPFNARMGRQPVMLPDLHVPPDGGSGRDMQRVREVALQRIIESTAVARITRASRGVTSVPGEVHDYKPDELVDFHRPPRSKDVTGWHGPAKVVRNVPERGQVILKWQRQELVCRYPDVRRLMDFNAWCSASSARRARHSDEPATRW